MITVKRLKELLSRLPADWDEAACTAYEGEDTGITIIHPDGRSKWIAARTDTTEDQQEHEWELAIQPR